MNNDILKNDSIAPFDRFKKCNSIINDFSRELQNYLDKVHSSKLISSLPKNTILTFAKYDKNFAICFDYKEKKIYYLSKELPQPGEALKFYSDDKFYLDKTAILAEENKLDDYLKECKLAQ